MAALGLQIAFIAGLMYTGVGLLRLGWITNFLSHTVVSGFMSGACITIALSQVGWLAVDWGRKVGFLLCFFSHGSKSGTCTVFPDALPQLHCHLGEHWLRCEPIPWLFPTQRSRILISLRIALILAPIGQPSIYT